MKKTLKLVALLMALVMVFAVVLAACDKDCGDGNHKDENHDGVCDVCGKEGLTVTHTWGSDNKCTVCGLDKSQSSQAFAYLEDYQAYATYELRDYRALVTGVDSTVEANVESAFQTGLANIAAATTNSEVTSALNAAKLAIAQCIPLASGVKDLTALSTDEKTAILGLLEAYAIRNGMTGVTLYESGGLVLYNPRIVLGSENYIIGYGFGVLAEGNITADLETESNSAWKRYYHTYNAKDPGNANYLNAQGSEIGDFYDYIGASYYTVFMNETKDGYEWVPELAVSDPVALNANESGQATKWRFEIRSGLKYNTLGSRTSYNGRDVVAEDFITPYKLLLNQANGYFRGSELANQTGYAAIKGAKEYYESTKNAAKGIDSGVSFDNVGVKVYEENGKWYFEYELGQATTMFYARYAISSSLHMPIPKAFIDEVGVDNYLGFNSDKSETPVDNSLSLGAYTFERWDSNQQIVYKKNPFYVHASTKFAIEGVHINILEAAQTDEEAGFREFLAGRIDGATVPTAYVDQYKNDPRARKATGGTCFKLNMNALDQATWNELFGNNGTVAQNGDGAWQVKPALSNYHFRLALSYALNRLEFANAKASTATVNYFGSAYLSDPEVGTSYNSTKEHKDAVANLLEGTDGYGYSLQLAREYFQMALDELEDAGLYTRGTKENPTVISLEIAWMSSSNEDAYHKYVKQYWEDAFNDDSVHGGCYKLEINFWCPSDNDYNKTYDKMLGGMYDIGFGSISGNSQDPLGFMEVLSTNQNISHEFTLNWAIDTNDPNADLLIYGGYRWSYDALLESTQQATKVVNGAMVSYVAPDKAEFEFDDAKETLTATITLDVADGVVIDGVDFVLYGYVPTAVSPYYAYDEWLISQYVKGNPVASNGKLIYTLEIPVEELLELDPDLFYANTGIDVYVSYHVPADGVTVEDQLLKSFPIEPTSAVGYADKDEGADSVTVTLTLKLLDGISADDLEFVFEGYTNTLSGAWLELEPTVTNNGNLYTFTFVISKADLEESGISGDVVGRYDLATYQGISVYLWLDEETYLVTASVSITLVEPADAE